MQRHRRTRAAKDASPNIYDSLSGELMLAEAARAERLAGLDMVPATSSSRARTSSCRASPGSETRLRERLGGVRERYLFTLLDCPPSLGPLTVNALVAAER